MWLWISHISKAMLPNISFVRNWIAVFVGCKTYILQQPGCLTSDYTFWQDDCCRWNSRSDSCPVNTEMHLSALVNLWQLACHKSIFWIKAWQYLCLNKCFCVFLDMLKAQSNFFLHVHIGCEMDRTGICGESNRLLPEANEHAAGYAPTERSRQGERGVGRRKLNQIKM